LEAGHCTRGCAVLVALRNTLEPWGGGSHGLRRQTMFGTKGEQAGEVWRAKGGGHGG